MRQYYFIMLFSVGLFGAGLTHPARAQGSFGGGVTFGMNVATLRAASADNLGYRTAASGGLFGQLHMVGPLAVRGELLFSQKGVKVDTEQGELTLKANYLEVPVLVVGHLPFARSYSPHLLAGPALGLKMYERQGAPGFSFETDETTFERTDAGVMVGAGASVGGGGALEIEVRYTFGLQDVTRTVSTAPLDESLPTDAQNGVWSVMLRFGV